MSLRIAYEHVRWHDVFAAEWRWPAAGVLIYLVTFFLQGVLMKDMVTLWCYLQKKSCRGSNMMRSGFIANSGLNERVPS